eukprot:2545245-Pyramimonas_sp.AAC.1
MSHRPGPSPGLEMDLGPRGPPPAARVGRSPAPLDQGRRDLSERAGPSESQDAGLRSLRDLQLLL